MSSKRCAQVLRPSTFNVVLQKEVFVDIIKEEMRGVKWFLGNLVYKVRTDKSM